VVTTTTFLVQIIGPPCVKLAVVKAGEVGRNVTEEDLLATYKVCDLMQKDPPVFAEGAPLHQMLAGVATSDAVVYPITGEGEKLTGVLRLIDLRAVLNAPALGHLVLACDLMQPVTATAAPDEPLEDALKAMRSRDLEFLPVVERPAGKLLGLLERRRIQRLVANEVIRRHREAPT
jgi:CBS domain-containing protein